MIAFTGCSTEYYENNFKYLQLERNIVTFIYESTIIGELYLYLRSFVGLKFPSTECFPPTITGNGVDAFSSFLLPLDNVSTDGPGCPGSTPCLESVSE